MDPSEFLKRLDSHIKWLRDPSKCKRADFTLEDLSGFDLTSVVLRKAKFTGANLSRCVLKDADLREADLCGADLGGANLRHANLSGADMRGVFLRGADLTDATMDRVDLRDGKLMTSESKDSGIAVRGHASEGQFTDKADLSGAKFSRASRRRRNGASRSQRCHSHWRHLDDVQLGGRKPDGSGPLRRQPR